MTIVEQIIRELEPLIDAQGWGVSPRLYLVYANDVKPATLTEVPTFRLFAGRVGTAQAIAAITSRLRGLAPRKSDVYGWLAVCETKKDSDADGDTFRTMALASYMGETAILNRTQTGGNIEVSVDGRDMVRGAVPAALWRLVKATKPKRKE